MNDWDDDRKLLWEVELSHFSTPERRQSPVCVIAESAEEAGRKVRDGAGGCSHFVVSVQFKMRVRT